MKALTRADLWTHETYPLPGGEPRLKWCCDELVADSYQHWREAIAAHRVGYTWAEANEPYDADKCRRFIAAMPTALEDVLADQFGDPNYPELERATASGASHPPVRSIAA